MSAFGRRELLRGLPGMSIVAAEVAESEAVEPVLTASKLFAYDSLPVKQNANGSQTRAVLHGALATGEAVEVHETTLAVGGAPNPPHAHRQSDMILVHQGTIAFEHDGKSERVAAGGVIFVASGTTHTIRNVGDGIAQYFVVIVGRDVAK